MSKKIIIGTAQFGMSYGVSNVTGQVSLREASEIILFSSKHGVDTVDTAFSYGENEKCLGSIGMDNHKVITKIGKIPNNCNNISAWMLQQLNESLNRLKTNTIDGLLLHDPMQLLKNNGNEIWDTLDSFKVSGKVEKIGFSIYSPEELDLLWDSFRPDMVQVPFNILDRRIRDTGWLSKLKMHNVEIHARSVFLQGLLLMNNNLRPDKFNQWSVIWDGFSQWISDQKLSPLEACLAYVEANEDIDCMVIGVESVEQLKEILNVKAVIREKIKKPFPTLGECDVNLINPSNWRYL